MKGTTELRTSRLVLRRYRKEDAPLLYRYFGIDEKMYEYSGWNPYATEELAAASVERFINSYQDPSFYGWAIEFKEYFQEDSVQGKDPAEDPGSESDVPGDARLKDDRTEGITPGGVSLKDDRTEGITPGDTLLKDDRAEGITPGGVCLNSRGAENLIGTIGAYDYDPEAGTVEIGLSIRRDCWGKGIATEALRAVLSYLTEEEEIAGVTAWCAAPNLGSKKAMEKAGMRQAAIEPSALKVGDAVYDKLVYEFRLPMDLTFRTECGTFNYRVGAVIIHDGRLLLMKNDEEPYYYTVGGRVRFNETTEETIIREVREEIGVSLEIDRFLFFQEQFFDGKVTGTHIHELGVYYLMKDSPALEHLTCHSVTARGVAEELHWIPLEEIGNYYIVPESVAAKLRNLPPHPEHIIEIDER